MPSEFGAAGGFLRIFFEKSTPKGKNYCELPGVFPNADVYFHEGKITVAFLQTKNTPQGVQRR